MPTSNALRNFLDWLGTTAPDAAGIPDEAKDPKEIFRRIEDTQTSPPGIRVVHDPERGKVWLFEKRPNDHDYRCESNGIIWRGVSYESWEEGDVYDFSWGSRLADAQSLVHGDYVIFQWKSYPEGVQNYPLLLSVQKNRLSLIHSNEQQKWIVAWEGSIRSDVWFDIRLRITLSRHAEHGNARLWFNDELQTFVRDRFGNVLEDEVLVCRTLDNGRGNYPKWGAYNREHCQHGIQHYLNSPRIRRIA